MTWLNSMGWQTVMPPDTIPTAPPPNLLWVGLGVPLIIVIVGIVTVLWLRWRETSGGDR
ncbi:MAG: hypothetical protein HZY76_21290 [Anaerolineae bacterium]|nr:MAG: hypothetical protein HZY76_21290 [Anaerolineae bacterium]